MCRAMPPITWPQVGAGGERWAARCSRHAPDHLMHEIDVVFFAQNDCSGEPCLEYILWSCGVTSNQFGATLPRCFPFVLVLAATVAIVEVHLCLPSPKAEDHPPEFPLKQSWPLHSFRVRDRSGCWQESSPRHAPSGRVLIPARPTPGQCCCSPALAAYRRR